MISLTSITSASLRAGLVGLLACSAACTAGGLVLTVDADQQTIDRLDAYCVNLGADSARRFGRRYTSDAFPFPQSLGIRGGDRDSVVVRLDGLTGGLRTSTRAASFAVPDNGDAQRAGVALTECASSGLSVQGAELVQRTSTSFSAERLSVLRTGAEKVGGAELVAMSAQAGLRASFVGVNALPSDRLDGTPISGAGGLVQQLAVLDSDEDCADDLLVAAEDHSPAVWPSDPQGLPMEDVSRIAAIPAARAVAVGDLDHDGRADVVTVGAEGGTVLLADLSVGAGGGYREEPGGFDVQPTQGRAIALGDLDGDAQLDLLVGFGTGPLRWWRNDGNGALKIQSALVGVSVEATSIVLYDLDSDGDLDALVGARNASPGLRVFINDGRGVFIDSTTTLVPADVDRDVLGLVLADLDGDCRDELLVVGSMSAPRLFGIDSTGFLDDRGSVGTVPARAATAGDLDGDGLTELVLAGPTELAVWSRPPRSAQ